MVLDINLGHDFLDLMPKAKATKVKFRLKSFGTVKKINKMKGNL